MTKGQANFIVAALVAYAAVKLTMWLGGQEFVNYFLLFVTFKAYLKVDNKLEEL